MIEHPGLVEDELRLVSQRLPQRLVGPDVVAGPRPAAGEGGGDYPGEVVGRPHPDVLAPQGVGAAGEGGLADRAGVRGAEVGLGRRGPPGPPGEGAKLVHQHGILERGGLRFHGRKIVAGGGGG